MKKKLTVNRLALGNLKARKKQYAILIIGIILAMIFSSSGVLIASSLQASKQEAKNIRLGSQDYILCDFDEAEEQKLRDLNYIEGCDRYDTLGFVYSEETGTDNGASVACFDEKARETYYLDIKEGKYPENEGEIAFEEAALGMLDIEASVGDEIALKLNVQNGKDYLNKPVDKTYKLVGIMKDKRANELRTYSYEYELEVNTQIPAAFVSNKEQIETGGKARQDALVLQNPKLAKSENNLGMYLINYPDGELPYQYHDTGIYYGGDNSSTIYAVMVSVIFTVILFVAASFAIVNAFSSNLNERKKQIGMLKTVGATKRQIINIFGREAFIIAIITMPISLLISYFGVKLVSHFIKAVFVFTPSPWMILLCAVVSIISVMLAAFIPLASAARISPIQSIRNIGYNYKLKKKKIKSKKEFDTSKLIAKRSLSFNRGKQAVVSVFLVIVIIVGGYGFGYVRTLTNEFSKHPFDYTLYHYDDNSSSDIYNEPSVVGFTNNDIKEIYQHSEVKKVYGTKAVTALINTDSFSEYDKAYCYYGPFVVFDFPEFGEEDDFYAEVTEENCDELFGKKFSNEYLGLKNRWGVENELMPIKLCGYDIDTLNELKEYVIDGKIDEKKLLSGEEIILYAPEHVIFRIGNNGCSYGLSGDDEVYEDETIVKQGDLEYKAGDELDLSIVTAVEGSGNDDYGIPNNASKKDFTVKIGAIVSDFKKDRETRAYNSEILDTANFSSYESWKIVTTNQAFEKYAPDRRYNIINVNTNGELDDDINEAIMSTLTQINDRQHGSYLVSRYEVNRKAQQENMTLLIIALSLTILFISISASIINNSLTAQIRANKRQIGTLRAVGASLREIMTSYIHQLLNMLLIGIISGFALYITSYLGIIAYQKIKWGGIDFMYFSIIPSMISCAVLFAICSFNLWRRIRNEMNNSIIDNIREL